MNRPMPKLFSAWLVPELSLMVPRSLKRAWRQPPVRLLFRVNGEHIDLELLRSRVFQEQMSASVIASGGWEAVRSAAEGVRRRWGRMLDCELAIPLRQCLTLEKSIPKAALADGLQILRLDYQRSNPNGLEDVYLGFELPLALEEKASESIAGTTIVCKRRNVDPHLAQMRALGFHASSIRAFDGSGALREVEITEGLLQPPRRSLMNKLLLLMTAILLTLLIATAVLKIWTLQQLVNSAETETAELLELAKDNRTQTEQSNNELESLRSLRARRAETLTVAETLEELTALLPDSAWVTELRIVDGEASIDGFASSASDLIGILAKSRKLASPEFSAPVSKVSEQNAERFQIRMKLLKPSGEEGKQ